MGKYVKQFNTHSEYNTYITGNTKILPNVSYCEDNDEVHFNPWTDPRVIAKFNVEDVTEPVALYGADYGVIASELFSKVEIDGEEISISDLEDEDGYYTFETTGEHTVKYTLSDSEVISEGTFYDCSGLTSITIPNSVTSIGEYAFSGCIAFTSITIPSSVTSIGNGAFSDCDGLRSMSVESGNTVYDSRNNCNAIIETATNTLLCGCQNTIIPSSVTSIGSNAFGYCSSLTRITIPNSVTSIGDDAFRGCNSLTSITIPSNVTSIGSNAFGYCSSLRSISVESGNTVYDSRNNCNAIIETATNKLISGCQNTIIPSSVTSIGEYAFSGCIALTSINIPSSVTSIGVGTFNNCSGLTSITIPSNVTSIGDDAFTDCSGLTHITIPNSVISIGEYAFSGCIAFTSITIPSSVTSIGNGAFSDCDGLRSMSVESGNTVYDSRNNCNAIIETATNTLLCGCQNTIIPSSVTSIGSNAFGYCSSLTRITIPNSVTSIGDDAFRGCNSLTSITIPSNVTSIGSNAFGYCSSLRSISVESGNTVYDSRNNCNAIIETATNKLISGCQNTIIPSSVTSIGEYAFSGCIALTSINIPSGVTSIGSWTFQGCRGLTSVTIPSSVTNIGNSVFYGCSGLTSITSLAITAPTIQSNTFTNIKTAGTLYVLSGSTGYDVWMGTGNYYLGKYNWTKVEQ